MHTVFKTPSEKDIYSFFTSLSEDTLYNFTLYPGANTRNEALKLSRTLLKNKSQKIFGAFNEGKMIGFGILKFFLKKTRKHVCQFGMVINDLHQGRGYGKALGEHVISWAKKHNFKKVWLNVYSDNAKAIKLYKNLGFQREGIFMYDEYFENKPRHSLSMALFFDLDPCEERGKLWEDLSKTPVLR